MFTLFFQRKPQDITDPDPVTAQPTAKSGKDLLSLPERAALVLKIKRLFSTTEEVWENHYLYAIERFAELVQEIPASEIHHHSAPGGLIDHTLEALHAGIRIAQGYVLPPNAEPERISADSDRWRFGAFIAILAHDIGKVVTDLEVVYRGRGGEFRHWHPWYEPIPLGSEYRYRYRKRAAGSKSAKTLHEQAAMSLLPRLLTRSAARWIFEDAELLAQLFSTVTHATFGGQAIAEIVRAADRASVAKNLGADTGVNTDHSTAIPLHEKLIVSLRKLINDGELKRNRPGAALWVTATDTWVVSRVAMDAVRVQLDNEGHKGIPRNVVRLFEVLREHDLLVSNSEGESVWIAEINDFARDWQQKLTFLRFRNEVIWPTSNPETFDGEVVVLNRQGDVVSESVIGTSETAPVGVLNESGRTPESFGAPDREQPDNQSPDSAGEDRPADSLPGLSSVDPEARDDKPGWNECKPPPATEDEQYENPQTPSIPPDSGKKAGLSSGEARGLWKHSKQVEEEVLKENEFFAWLLRGIARRQIRVNEAKAPVHILEKHVALVTPAIFLLYLKKNPLKKKLYEKRAGAKAVYTVLQKELAALDIHQRGVNGQNIVNMSVDGQWSRSELRVYLLNRDCFPSLRNFSPNKVMAIEL